MLALTIETPGPYTEGQELEIHRTGFPRHMVWAFRATVFRVESHELLVRVGGRGLAFQELDGHGNGWMWREG